MEVIDANLPETDRGARLALRDAQRPWIAKRDAACAAEASTVRGGRMKPWVLFGWLGRVTSEPTAALQGMQGG